VKTEILYTLAVINLSIWTIFGSLAYWFAGKTLQPIEEMTQKQKQFIADAAHELKTPLTAIKTNLEVNLRAKNITKEQSLEVIKDTIQDVDTLTELTKNLLIQSRYETTKALKLEKVDLKTTVQKILKQNKARIANKKINLVTELTSTNILATNASVKELITILLDNAIKFTNTEGDIYLSIKTQQAHVEFTVANTGEQINSQDLEHIFDRFYKAKKSRTNSKEEGYGIGLAVAKEITQKINSIINVSSNPELTTFTITFPKA
ncbi:HAMP domain-containing histidine kinase, partial [candidate division WWE3 bacterium]|nr:HAMP domain-containing histidine kinase [candidate division WWE3 bacterium]